jgi:hypothetical protein
MMLGLGTPCDEGHTPTGSSPAIGEEEFIIATVTGDAHLAALDPGPDQLRSIYFGDVDVRPNHSV